MSRYSNRGYEESERYSKYDRGDGRAKRDRFDRYEKYDRSDRYDDYDRSDTYDDYDRSDRCDRYDKYERNDRNGSDNGKPNRLYVGRLSSSTRTRDLEILFSKYGKIRDVEIKGDYAFVEHYDARDADDARYFLHGKELNGKRIIVEFTRRKETRGWQSEYPPSRNIYYGRGPQSVSSRCYSCGEEGHWARDCRLGDWRHKCYRCGMRGHIERNCRNSPHTRRDYSRSLSPSRSRTYSPTDYSRSRRKYSKSPYRSRSPICSRRQQSPYTRKCRYGTRNSSKKPKRSRSFGPSKASRSVSPSKYSKSRTPSLGDVSRSSGEPSRSRSYTRPKYVSTNSNSSPTNVSRSFSPEPKVVSRSRTPSLPNSDSTSCKTKHSEEPNIRLGTKSGDSSSRKVSRTRTPSPQEFSRTRTPSPREFSRTRNPSPRRFSRTLSLSPSEISRSRSPSPRMISKSSSPEARVSTDILKRTVSECSTHNPMPREVSRSPWSGSKRFFRSRNPSLNLSPRFASRSPHLMPDETYKNLPHVFSSPDSEKDTSHDNE